MSAWGVVTIALLFGVGSALVPVLNAEAYALAAVVLHPASVAGIVLALAVGQTLGKVMLLEATRRGAETRIVQRLRRRVATMAPSGRATRSRYGGSRRSRLLDQQRAMRLLDSPRAGGPLVGCSAAFGLPPLALVAVAAGLGGQRLRVFVPWCLVGRTARFGALVLGASAVT
jgi:hypothetical protein